MKRLLLSSILLIGIISSSAQPNTTQEEKVVRNRVVEIFTDVYKQYALCNKHFSDKNYIDNMPSLDDQFCSKDWNTTVNAVIEKMNKTGDYFLDVDYWINAQDFGDTKFRQVLYIKPREDGSYLAKIEFQLFEDSNNPSVSSDANETILVKLIKERGNWFIDDFLNDNTDETGDHNIFSWKKWILEYLAE